MQLVNLKYIISVCLLIFLIGCENSPKNEVKEINNLIGHWQSSDVISKNNDAGEYTVAIVINKNGNGNFKSVDKSGKIDEFNFEILVGVEKVALFLNDGTFFLYEYTLTQEKLVLESVVDGSVLKMNRKVE